MSVTGSEYLGYSGTATFTETAGSNSLTTLYMGYNSGSVGTYGLSTAGSPTLGLLSASNEYVGYSGTGLHSKRWH